MPIDPNRVENTASEAISEQVRAAQELYFTRFGVRLDSRYVVAIQNSPLSVEQKVGLIRDVIELTGYILDTMPSHPLSANKDT